DQVGQAPRDGVAVKQAFFTKTPEALFAITAGWPGDRLVLRGVRAPADAAVTMLGVPGTLRSSVVGDAITIETPDLGPEDAPCRHAFAFKIPGAELIPVE
ncbi:MAG TPA: alpha-L-fucosidase C-terminal domain-containing protein, partial [Isosphaeraceae bacterium]